MTVDCSACAKGQTIEEYCEDEENKEKPGCEGRNLQLQLAMSKFNYRGIFFLENVKHLRFINRQRGKHSRQTVRWMSSRIYGHWTK